MTTPILFVSTGNRVRSQVGLQALRLAAPGERGIEISPERSKSPRCFGGPGPSRARLEEWFQELHLPGDAR